LRGKAVDSSLLSGAQSGSRAFQAKQRKILTWAFAGPGSLPPLTATSSVGDQTASAPRHGLARPFLPANHPSKNRCKIAGNPYNLLAALASILEQDRPTRNESRWHIDCAGTDAPRFLTIAVRTAICTEARTQLSVGRGDDRRSIRMYRITTQSA
jgi:hypothetical protein